MRILALTLILAAFVAGGCVAESAAVAPAGNKQAATAAAPSTRAATQIAEAATKSAADGGPVMALINGQPIYMSVLMGVLVRDYGMMPAQQLIADELVRQEAVRNKIAITDADIAAETDIILTRAVGTLPPADQREKLLESLLVQMNIPKPMWNMLVRRQAILHKLAETKVKVTDDDLQDEFLAQYGNNVVVRDIQVGSLQDGEKILKQLGEIKDPAVLKAAFIKAAQTSSLNQATAQNGGLLPTINSKTSDTVVLPAIRKQALAMKKVGQISQLIQTSTAFHILYVDNIIEQKDVKFADVREKLTKLVRERAIGMMQMEILKTLIENARRDGKIEFVNPVLKAQDLEDQKRFKSEMGVR